MTIYLKDVLPLELLLSHLANGVIRRQSHPKFPELYVYNYTEQAAFDRVWDAASNVCRGLIVCGKAGELPSDTDVVIARGFNKFHNLNTEFVPETMEDNLPKDVPLVTEKLDGSMGVLYFYNGEWAVATRGSFDSDQARWATAWLRDHYFAIGQAPVWLNGFTPVVEIIYDENRIVVQYDFDGLVLLSLVENATGQEASRYVMEKYASENCLFPVEKFVKSLAECASEDNPNEEGYVLTYSNGLKIKVKFAEYVRLHRILTGLNPKAIWELLSEKSEDTVYLWLNDEKMPDEFKKWLSGWVNQFKAKYEDIHERAKIMFHLRPREEELGRGPLLRKAQAMYFLKTPDLAHVCFAMLDGKDCSEIIWRQLKPKATDTFKADDGS